MRDVNESIVWMNQIVREQLTDALSAFSAGNLEGAETVVERDDVVDGLRAALEERCFELIGRGSGVIDERHRRGALRVVYNLERVGDAACHIAKHALMLVHEGYEGLPFRLEDFTSIAITAMDNAVTSFVKRDMALARQACELECELDELYVVRLEEIAGMINRRQIPGRLAIHALAVLKYLEKVSDFAENIGETTIYTLMGTRVTYSQFKQLDLLYPNGAEAGASYKHFWDGISGATVIEIDAPRGRLVFKEGTGRKIRNEFDRTIEWEGIAPNHTPRIVASSREGGRSGILREFVDGSLLLDVLLSNDEAEQKVVATQHVANVLVDIWSSTIMPQPPRIDYTSQMRTRLREVLRRHPALERVARETLSGSGGLYDLLSLVQDRENTLAPPFSIWTHGDLNANNIVIEQTGEVMFIDVHRSRYGDFVQDLSILTTSALRKFPRGRVAKAVAQANDVFIEAGAAFAAANGDRHFRKRLRLARARAFITSARLDSDPERAKLLFVSGLEMLKKAAKELGIGKAG